MPKYGVFIVAIPFVDRESAESVLKKINDEYEAGIIILTKEEYKMAERRVTEVE
jgi:vacuolar-type H+-ATPase subunit F/Vma7